MIFLMILISLLSYTCYKAIQLNPDQLYLMTSITFIFFVIMFAPSLMSRKQPRLTEYKWFDVFNWVGSTFIGIFATFILISLPLDLFILVMKLFTSEILLNTDVYRIIFVISAAMTLLGFLEVLRGPRIVDVSIPLGSHNPALNGFKIAQISDLHIGPTIKTNYVKKVVKKTNDLNADIIVITGDLVDYHFEAVVEHLQPFKDLKAQHGVFYVTGNHEYYWGVNALLPELERVGLKILSNSNTIIERNGAKILIAGLPDPTAGQISKALRPNLEAALKSSSHTDLKILLAHRPDPYQSAESMGIDIQFSGHTHAGQFFPFSLLIPFAHKYYKGLNRYKKLWLYVNPGTGYWGPANRFGVKSEITQATLVVT